MLVSMSHFSVQLVFKRHAHDRTIKFATISELAQIPMDQVCNSVAYLNLLRMNTGIDRRKLVIGRQALTKVGNGHQFLWNTV